MLQIRGTTSKTGTVRYIYTEPRVVRLATHNTTVKNHVWHEWYYTPVLDWPRMAKGGFKGKKDLENVRREKLAKKS